MSLLFNADNRYEALGRQLVKLAADAPEPVYAMAGKLYLSASGWLLLSVPNGLARSIYENLDEVGVELPPGKDGQPFNAHISVMRPEEIKEIGGADVISERGHVFHYNIGRLAVVTPAGWPEMSKCWLIQVTSPELMQLRRSYGLSPLPQRNNESLPFHITVAVRRKGVLRSNEISKVSTYENGGTDADQLEHDSATDRGDSDGNLVHGRGSAVLFGVAGKVSGSLAAQRSAALAGSPGARQSNTEGAACGDGGARNEKSSGVSEVLAALAQARKDTETNPSEAQREAGNYAKGKFRWKGLEIALENPKGSTRSGVSPDGKAWSNKMVHDYGYIKGTVDNDDDHVDIFMGPDVDSDFVVVINQVDPATGKFDEHKVMLGFTNEADAVEGYLANYDEGWQGMDHASCCTIRQFKWWLEFGDQTKMIPEDMFAKHRRKAAAAGDDGVLIAGIKTETKETHDPICPHCEAVMYEKHFVPDRENEGLWRHRGECYDKGPFRIEWPDQAERDAEVEAFFKRWNKESSQIEEQDADYWNSPKNTEGRRCKGCNQLFKECEPLPGVEMCEVCERFGKPKEVEASVFHRAFSAQLTSPTWNKNDDVFTNLLGNVSQLRERGKRMKREHHNARAFEEVQNPGLGYERLRRIFAGEQEPEDPVDQLVFGEELA